MSKREAQIILKTDVLKTDQRNVILELGLGGKFQAKSSGWDENRTFLEGDVLEVAVGNGRWVLTHVPAGPRPWPSIFSGRLWPSWARPSLCADLGITPEPREDHAAYLVSWLDVLKNDKRAIFTAAGHAQRAVDYLHSLQPKAGDMPEEAALCC
jgi:Zincin-like metallopeptidase